MAQQHFQTAKEFRTRCSVVDSNTAPDHAFNTMHLVFACTALAAVACATASRAAIAPGPYDVKTVAGVVYNPASASTDSYLKEPANGLIECLPQPRAGQWAGPFPGMIFIHGGAWRANSVTQRLPECQLWASYGFVAITVQYRLVVAGNPETYWPAQLLDVQAAVRWFKTNGRSLNMNMDALGAWGDSAGGQLADFLGWLPETVHFGGDPIASLFPVYSSHVGFVVSEFGPTYFGPAMQPGAPSNIAFGLIEQYHYTAAPTLFVQGTRDTTVAPVNSTDAYYKLLSYHHADADFMWYDGAHEFIGLAAPSVDAVHQRELDFSIGMARTRGAYFAN